MSTAARTEAQAVKKPQNMRPFGKGIPPKKIKTLV